VRRVSKKYPSVKDGDIDDRASRFIRGGKKTDGHFTLRPILHNTSSPLSLPFGKKNGWQCQNVSRHQILAQPAADTIQYRCLLFFSLLTLRSSNLYRVVFSPGHTTGYTHRYTHHSRSICWRRNVVTVSCSILVHLFRSPSPPSKKVRLLLGEGKSNTRNVPASAVGCNNPPR
jgi:hypothetical protein